MKTYKEDDSDALKHDIHIWIGADSTQDEYGTAAYKVCKLLLFTPTLFSWFYYRVAILTGHLPIFSSFARWSKPTITLVEILFNTVKSKDANPPNSKDISNLFATLMEVSHLDSTTLNPLSRPRFCSASSRLESKSSWLKSLLKRALWMRVILSSCMVTRQMSGAGMERM